MNLRTGIKQEIKDYLDNIEGYISKELLECLLDNLEDELSERIHETVDMCIEEDEQ